MQFANNKERLAVLLGAGIVMAIVLFAVIAKYNDQAIPLDNAYKNIVEKKKILSQLRIHFHKSVEMEKNAVMALTDEDSRKFADQSRAASATVEQDLRLLRSLSEAIPAQDEKALLAEFTLCWAELGTLDQLILGLAVENTNLKAASLSREQGAEAMRRLEQALEALRTSHSGTPNEGRVTGLVYQALTGALKIYNLHSSHIAEANDEHMNHIEAQVKEQEAEVATSFDALAAMVGEEGRDSVSQAKAAFAEFMALTAKVIELSRQNSNIRSLDLSLGRKRKIAAQCEEILATFQETVQNKTFKATR